jgi:hypothetical protein
MAALDSLKLVAAKQVKGLDPKHLRRIKMLKKLKEQIDLAEGEVSGHTYIATKSRSVLNSETGVMESIQVPKRLKPWWWLQDNGKMCITLRYGAKALEISRGKNAIEVNGLDDIVAKLKVIKTAVEAGELDTQMESLSAQLKAGFAKRKASEKINSKA